MESSNTYPWSGRRVLMPDRLAITTAMHADSLRRITMVLGNALLSRCKCALAVLLPCVLAVVMTPGGP